VEWVFESIFAIDLGLNERGLCYVGFDVKGNRSQAMYLACYATRHISRVTGKSTKVLSTDKTFCQKLQYGRFFLIKNTTFFVIYEAILQRLRYLCRLLPTENMVCFGQNRLRRNDIWRKDNGSGAVFNI
jgi:hypothetical protein